MVGVLIIFIYLWKCSFICYFFIIQSIREAAQKKNVPKKCKKSIIFLTPPPRIMWTFLNLGRIEIWWPPPLRPKLGKIWNVGIFEIIAPPLTLAKTVPKSYQTVKLRLIQSSYISQMCTKCCLYTIIILPIPIYQGHISVIWIWENSDELFPLFWAF